jgi:hypothetical protein
VAWLAGWILLVVLDPWPSTTFIDHQLGGVEGETIVVGVAGALIGLAYSAFRL